MAKGLITIEEQNEDVDSHAKSIPGKKKRKVGGQKKTLQEATDEEDSNHSTEPDSESNNESENWSDSDESNS